MRMIVDNNTELQVWEKNNELNINMVEEDSNGDIENIISVSLTEDQARKLAKFIAEKFSIQKGESINKVRNGGLKILMRPLPRPEDTFYKETIIRGKTSSGLFEDGKFTR